jgi:DNA-binding transcriptional MerR regulator
MVSMSTTIPSSAGPVRVHEDAAPADPDRLLRIQEVSELVGLTPRTIRYYEEVGLLEPAARSEGAYRLYDADDLERLRFIKGMRDHAGFSLAEIATLVEDEEARSRSRERYLASSDPTERREIMKAAADRLDRQVTTLAAKRERLDAMIAEAKDRRERVARRLAELEAELGGRPAARKRVGPAVASGARRKARP